MRIVIDMQGVQTESRFRGIGRYTTAFAQGVVRNRGQHEVILALSGLFPDTIESIRADFDGLLPQENIRVWQAPGPVMDGTPGNEARRDVAESMREAFLASLQPDVIHITSLFQGYEDDAVTSIGRFDTHTPVSVSLYDLIPLLNPGHYLAPHPRYERFYHRKIAYLEQAASLLAISEFARQEGIEHLDVPDSRIVNVSTAIDTRFKPISIDADVARPLYDKVGITRPFVLYAGGADERKNLPRLIQAYASLPSSLRDQLQLLFAGKMPIGHVANFKQQAKLAGLKPDELCFTGYISDDELVQLYNLCKLYVFPSWHEGFGLPALEAMACGAPVIGANTSSLPEVIGLDDALFDPLDVSSMSEKMEQALKDEAFRTRLTEHGLQRTKIFSWDKTAQRAIETWETQVSVKEQDYLDQTFSEKRLYADMAVYPHIQEQASLIELSACLAQNYQTGVERQLLLDISELFHQDSATGVQRVVRSYLKCLLHSPPAGFRVEPVYANRDTGYRYARSYTQRFLGKEDRNVSDDPIRWQRGDVFFGLDMQHYVQIMNSAFYQFIRRDGVVVKFLVHDLLPIQTPELFWDSSIKKLHEQWLTMIAATDGAICVSKATSDALKQWIAECAIPTAPAFQNTWVHNGADIDGSAPSRGLPADVSVVIDQIRARPTFLSVATLEPRKGLQQVLDAVELLWEQGVDANLVLVGKQGWNMDILADRIRRHSKLGHRLFWLQGISDEYLEHVYSNSACLIAASINEGFGLPLIEAARHKIPVIARDIAVFREVAGDHAYYFSGETAIALADALNTWLELYRQAKHPPSEHMRWSTWQQSTDKLKKALVDNNYSRSQLLVDISALARHDTTMSAHFIERRVLKEWLINPPQKYRIEPVYATVDRGYCYARQFTADFLDCPADGAQDEPIDYAPGDVFFAIAPQVLVHTKHSTFYQHLRNQGIRVLFAVYELPSKQMPNGFSPEAEQQYLNWLEIVGENDGAVCLSNTVATELNNWVNNRVPDRVRPFNIDRFHPGADAQNPLLSTGMPSDADVSQSAGQLLNIVVNGGNLINAG